jgi:hypothetical protein
MPTRKGDVEVFLLTGAARPGDNHTIPWHPVIVSLDHLDGRHRTN